MTFPLTADLDIIVEAFIGADLDDTIDDWPAATDLSSRLLRKPIQIRRGRGQNQKTAQAGACTFWLDNTDGALTPLLPTSVYYPDWDLGCPIRVSVDGVGADPPYVRHAGFIADISAVMVPGVGGLNISAVRVTSAGVLRRLTQGAVVKSALRRLYLGANQRVPLAYWPCEDQEGATQVASGLPGGIPLTGVTPHFSSGAIAGSDGALDLTQLAAVGPHMGDGPTAQITLPTADGFQLEYSLLGTASDIVLLFSCGTLDAIPLLLNAAFIDGLPHHQSYIIRQSGADVVWDIYRDGVFITTATVATGTLSTSLTITVVTSDAFGSTTLLISHILVWSYADATEPTSRAAAVSGYDGEQAHVRAERICGQEGIPYSGTASQSNECGPQPVVDVIGALQDLETVDHGMLIEDFGWGFDYRASSQRENLTPALTVDLSTYRTTAGTQGDVLTPIRNDARLRNEWTINRPDGSSATATDAVNIAKRGRFNDSATVNVETDGRALDEAQWRVHEGTFDKLRYETVPLDIAANLGD